MMELFEASLRFPTVVFTIGLGIVLMYWLFVLIGALDIDLLGGGEVDLDGDGIADVLTGGAKGGAEAIKGAAHGGDVDADGVFAKLGLGVVPITISVSLIMLVGWTGSLLVMHYIGWMPWVKWVLLPGMLIVAMLVTSVLIKPLAPVFRIREGKSNREYIGHTCTVSTATVDDNFGHASVEDGGTTLDIPVRCDRTGKLVRGDKAIIIDFDDARQAYLVEPVADILSSSKSGEAS